MAIVELTVCPLGTGTTSASKYVAGAHEILSSQSSVKYMLNPMGTVMEGNIDEIFSLIRKIQEDVFDKGVDRVYSIIKVDDRRDKISTMEQKLNSVNSKLK
ncbi:MAG: MTH1187 family thiamine-binding protein [Peptostreptococcus porci]|uniref:MTH1187 family thiamine-binding protein n=1 Tax=Peptostreptococcus porci TaxID=2652282 RepID=UPI002A83A5D1|nr:MTH1187 family thiamine-binding protein [Peptostreptococcus porci]MDY4127977.1 MTH1187 family thiamine-binding protein [Peptostreptococcus porci]MDY4561814.1 MTH1187 family thiamine-binding protein [Peptostreptococcus porci]